MMHEELLDKEIWVTEFTEKSAQDFREHLFAKAAESKSAPILIYIDSYGGHADSLTNMFESMDSVPNKIITICNGKAMSCGAMLLAHGDIRVCGPYSRVMIHEVSAGTGEHVHDMVNDAKEVGRLNKFLMGILAKDCKIKGGYTGLRKRIKENDGRELWLDADAALKFGVVDHIGRVDVQKASVYNVLLLEHGE